MCNLTDEEKVKCIIKYTDSKMKSFWKSLGGFKEKDWGALKEWILNAYPDAKKGEAHTHNKLKMLMKHFSTKYISSETDLVKYYQLFRPVAQALVKNKRISKGERDCLFWKGLPKAACKTIIQQLEVREGKEFSRENLPGMDKVFEAGREVYGEDAFEVSNSESEEEQGQKEKKMKKLRGSRGKKHRSPSSSSSDNSGSDSSDSDDNSDDESSDDDRKKKKGKGKKGPEIRTKKVVVKDEKQGGTDNIKELMRKLHGMNVTDVNYTVCFTKLTMIAPSVMALMSSP